MLEQIAVTAEPEQQHAAALAAVEAAREEMFEAVKAEQERVSSVLQSLGSILQRKADERVGLRSEIEQRWLRNIRQLNGIYEKEDLPEKKSDDQFGSRVYVPLTRRLRNMAHARVCDVLFTSDDRFWVLKPSPKAQLADVMDMVSALAPEQRVSVPGFAQQTTAKAVGEAVRDMQKEAELRASRMQRQVDDRLAEGRFPAKARRALEDAIDLGTGVMKGPVNELRTSRAWVPGPDGQMSLVVTQEVVPTCEYVDLWYFYPDMSSNDIETCSDVLEAHPMSRMELLALRDQPGFLAAPISEVCKAAPRPDNKVRRQDLRDLAGLSGAPDERYIVWEFNGPVRGSDLNACMRYERLTQPAEGDDFEDLGEDEYDDDQDYYCTVWFVDGHVIKAVQRPLKTDQRHIYSVVYWQRDKSSIFGFSLGDEVRDQQTSSNSSFRGMMDNLGLCIGPQIVFDEDGIVPVDGVAELRPFKMWRKKRPGKVEDLFGFFQIDSRLNELGQVFDRSKGLMDEVATLPAFVSGTEQPNMQSATQATLTYNASSLWVRRVVRHWDDDMVEPMMGRFVDWEMDHNPDPSIKGDFKPVARGATALIELEGQGQRMVQFMQLASSMGVPLPDQLRMLRQFARSLKLDPDDMLPTEEEVKQMRTQQGQQPNIEERKIEVAQENNRMDHQAKMAELQGKEADRQLRGEEYARREKLALLQLAAQERMTLEETARKYGYDLAKLEKEMVEADKQRAHEAQMQNAETAVKLRTGSGL